ncbi:MAG: hypothetical protein IJE43_01880 [Alphaproteobacteria bacterium]|nr:hypothetical protein [Alphaproteobacteria bacterium]
MNKKTWYTPKCDGCKAFNPECLQGCCYLYGNKKYSETKRKISNTS